MRNKAMTCIQCGTEFVFSAQEQKRFIAKGFAVPKRCPECRKRKARGIEIDEEWGDKGRKRHGRHKENYGFFE